MLRNILRYLDLDRKTEILYLSLQIHNNVYFRQLINTKEIKGTMITLSCIYWVHTYIQYVIPIMVINTHDLDNLILMIWTIDDLDN